jgi:peptidoglycan hydrolase-like protein with peptidoglycan-binding domain
MWTNVNYQTGKLMPLLTIFSAPKPFTDPHINTIQRNAVRNWQALGPDVEVFLVGEETGMAEVAAEYGVRHLPDVQRNEFGTPLVSSIFQVARQASESPLLCYVNADMLFLPEFLDSCRAVSAQRAEFLIIGQRWDLDITTPFDFTVPDWAANLKAFTLREGGLHAPAGSDYFVFRRSQYENIPDFAIGRPSWDNWMIYHARKQGWPVIDGTPTIQIIHQNHDYSHLPGGKPPYGGVEGNRNIALARGDANEYSAYLVLDTNKELREEKITAPKLTLPRVLRRIEVSLMPPDEQGPRFSLARRIERWRKQIVKARYVG